MKSLVTCDQVGGSLEMWLKTASPEQLQDFYTQLLKHIKNCDGVSLTPSTKLATCENLEDALAEAFESYSKNLNQGENLPADASDCSRPVTICGVNNMLNAAEDNAAKQAVANAIKNKALADKDFRIALGQALLSKNAGNRIEVRGDGIGVWDTAPPDLQIQYVDAINGDDNNQGTRDKPLRTIQKAIVRIGSKVGQYTIAIKAGQTHIVRDRLSAPNADLYIDPYGEATYDMLASGIEKAVKTGYQGWKSEDYNRPIVRFEKHLFTDVVGGTYSINSHFKAKSISIWATVLEQDDGKPSSSLYGDYMFEVFGLAWLAGCIVKPGENRIVGRAPSWLLHHSRFEPKQGSKLVDVAYGANVTVWGGGRVHTDGANGYPAFYSIDSNFVEAITPENLGASFDRPTKRLFGVSTSWDIFAKS